MDVEPSGEHGVFRTTDAEEARAQMGRILRDHRLDPSGELDVRCRLIPYGDVSMVYVQYGARVRIRSDPPESFRVVQIPLTGRVRVRTGAEDIATDPSVASVPDPDAPLDMNVHADSRHLLVRIDRAALDSHVYRILGRAPDSPLRLSAAMSLRAPATRSWLESLRMLQTDAEGTGVLRDSRLRPQFEQLIMAQFLLAQPNNYAELLGGDIVGRSTPRPIRRAEQLIAEHAREMLTVADIAEAVGLSVRTLQEGFRRYLDTTPTERLREARLVGVHADLAEADPTTATVAAIAADWGFWHLGRFAMMYRRRWGVSPSTTLRS